MPATKHTGRVPSPGIFASVKVPKRRLSPSRHCPSSRVPRGKSPTSNPRGSTSTCRVAGPFFTLATIPGSALYPLTVALPPSRVTLYRVPLVGIPPILGAGNRGGLGAHLGSGRGASPVNQRAGRDDCRQGEPRALRLRFGHFVLGRLSGCASHGVSGRRGKVSPNGCRVSSRERFQRLCRKRHFTTAHASIGSVRARGRGR